MSTHTKEPAYLVYSREHNAWWGNNSCGYRVRIEEAGRYTRGEAEHICRQANVRTGECGDGPPEFMMLAPESVECVNALADLSNGQLVPAQLHVNAELLAACKAMVDYMRDDGDGEVACVHRSMLLSALANATNGGVK